MKKYKLKKEAVPFFDERHATSIYDFDTWKGMQVDINALDEVKSPYLSYGHRQSEISKTCAGWERGKGSYFEFTIHFPNIQFHDHDKITNGKMIRDLMDRIQNRIDNYYDQFSFAKISEEQE